MPLTVTADHRVVNGAEVALVSSTPSKSYLEHPEELDGSGRPRHSRPATGITMWSSSAADPAAKTAHVNSPNTVSR